jgi:hypothetical protein
MANIYSVAYLMLPLQDPAFASLGRAQRRFERRRRMAAFLTTVHRDSREQHGDVDPLRLHVGEGRLRIGAACVRVSAGPPTRDSRT